MIKGVNRRVVEVTDTQNQYFERILFFVRAEHSDTSEMKIRESAKAIADAASEPPSSRIRFCRIKKIMKFVTAGLIGAIISSLIILSNG